MSIHFRYFIYILLAWIISPITAMFAGWIVAILISQKFSGIAISFLIASLYVAVVSFVKAISFYPFSERFIEKAKDHLRVRSYILMTIPIILAVSMSIITLFVGERYLEKSIVAYSLISLIPYIAIHVYLWKNWDDLFRK